MPAPHIWCGLDFADLLDHRWWSEMMILCSDRNNSRVGANIIWLLLVNEELCWRKLRGVQHTLAYYASAKAWRKWRWRRQIRRLETALVWLRSLIRCSKMKHDEDSSCWQIYRVQWANNSPKIQGSKTLWHFAKWCMEACMGTDRWRIYVSVRELFERCIL